MRDLMKAEFLLDFWVVDHRASGWKEEQVHNLVFVLLVFDGTHKEGTLVPVVNLVKCYILWRGFLYVLAGGLSDTLTN